MLIIYTIVKFFNINYIANIWIQHSRINSIYNNRTNSVTVCFSTEDLLERSNPAPK